MKTFQDGSITIIYRFQRTRNIESLSLGIGLAAAAASAAAAGSTPNPLKILVVFQGIFTEMFRFCGTTRTFLHLNALYAPLHTFTYHYAPLTHLYAPLTHLYTP